MWLHLEPFENFLFHGSPTPPRGQIISRICQGIIKCKNAFAATVLLLAINEKFVQLTIQYKLIIFLIKNFWMVFGNILNSNKRQCFLSEILQYALMSAYRHVMTSRLNRHHHHDSRHHQLSSPSVQPVKPKVTRIDRHRPCM